VPNKQGEDGDGRPLSDRERDENEPRLTDAPHVAIIATLGVAADLLSRPLWLQDIRLEGSTGSRP
jgi:hypothetical protein